MKQTCPECNRMGILTDIDPHAYGCPFTEVVCHVCDGEGEIDALCDTCGEPVRDDGYCTSCADWQIIVVVDPDGNGRLAA